MARADTKGIELSVRSGQARPGPGETNRFPGRKRGPGRRLSAGKSGQLAENERTRADPDTRRERGKVGERKREWMIQQRGIRGPVPRTIGQLPSMRRDETSTASGQESIRNCTNCYRVAQNGTKQQPMGFPRGGG